MIPRVRSQRGQWASLDSLRWHVSCDVGPWRRSTTWSKEIQHIIADYMISHVHIMYIICTYIYIYTLYIYTHIYTYISWFSIQVPVKSPLTRFQDPVNHCYLPTEMPWFILHDLDWILPSYWGSRKACDTWTPGWRLGSASLGKVLKIPLKIQGYIPTVPTCCGEPFFVGEFWKDSTNCIPLRRANEMLHPLKPHTTPVLRNGAYSLAHWDFVDDYEDDWFRHYLDKSS